MIIKRKTQIILALIITCIFLFQNCALISRGTSKRKFPERREGSIILTKKDGRQIEGELITVKENSLLLLNTEGKDVSIDIADIRVIRIVKKSKVWTGAGSGLLIGGINGILLIPAFKALAGEDFILDSLIENIEEHTHSLAVAYILIGGAVGLLIGGIFGAVAGIDNTILLEGRHPSSIESILIKLRKKARIRDYK